MASLEQEAQDRKARLAALRGGRGTEEAPGAADGDTHAPKRAKLAKQRNFQAEEDEDAEIQRLVVSNEESVETVSRRIEEEELQKYAVAARQDWTEDDVQQPRQGKGSLVEQEYGDKLKLQEMELLRMTKARLDKMRNASQ